MVPGEVPDIGIGLGAATGDDAQRTTVVQPGGVHGVFPVVACGLLRQDALIVAEAGAVIVRVGEGTAGQDVLHHRFGLIGQALQGAGGQATGGA